MSTKRRLVLRWWPLKWPFKLIDVLPGKIIYQLPQPAIFTKAFNTRKAFQANPKGLPPVDWSDWNETINEYRRRIIDWYFQPVSNNPVTNSQGDFDPAYPLMFTICAFIDLLTQYRFGLEWHSPKKYKQFLKDYIPEFKEPLSRPITYSVYWERHKIWQKATLKTRSDVFYAGVRCSMLHHGDLAPFCGMTALPQDAGKDVLMREYVNAGKSACGKHTYSLLVFHPYVLKERILTVFNTCCADLIADPTAPRANDFRRKFEEDYGIPLK
jgi:hypothetical protein